MPICTVLLNGKSYQTPFENLTINVALLIGKTQTEHPRKWCHLKSMSHKITKQMSDMWLQSSTKVKLKVETELGVTWWNLATDWIKCHVTQIFQCSLAWYYLNMRENDILSKEFLLVSSLWVSKLTLWRDFSMSIIFVTK